MYCTCIFVYYLILFPCMHIMYYFNVARVQKYDVVLVDTAGRMQDNEPLMKALAKVIIHVHCECGLYIV